MRADYDHNAVSELFDQIFSATPWPMLMLGEDGTVLGASDECTVAGSPGVARADRPLRKRAPHYLSLLSRGVPLMTPQEVDSVRELPSGAVIYEQLHLRRMPWGASLVIVDQTKLRQLQTADTQTVRLAALGFMVAGVCHEVTNPLTSLNSMVQILRSEKQPSRELVDKGLENIAINVKRILDIARRLVNFSRVGDEPRHHFPIDHVIDDALLVLREDGRLHDIELHFEPDPPAKVFGNTGQVREIFVNLLANAVQAMGGRGRLSVTTRRAGSMVEVVVGDTGPGVPVHLAARIFEPFFTTKANGQGTGLGLPICTEIAHEHGGTVELISGPAPGAWFRVTLPQEAS